MKRSIRKLCAGGDAAVCEWDTETVTKERLEMIETEFRQMIVRGHTAFDITDKRDSQIREFNPDADTLMVPRMVGG